MIAARQRCSYFRAGGDPADVAVIGLAEDDGGGAGGAALHRHLAAAAAVLGRGEVAGLAAAHGLHRDALLVAVFLMFEGSHGLQARSDRLGRGGDEQRQHRHVSIATVDERSGRVIPTR